LYDANKDKVQGNYTDGSWKNFVISLNNAKVVLDKVDATQSEIDDVLQALKVEVNSLILNRVPVLSGIENKTVDEGQNITFTISGIDEDNDTLSYSASGLPTGAAFNTATQAFSWTPNYTQSGDYDITFTVSDGKLTASQSVRITVGNVTPSELINKLVYEISSEEIPVGTELGGSALRSLEKGNAKVAVSQLNTWTKQIKRAIGITNQKADYLIEKIRFIISLIESEN
jgi:hypothetical protein